MSTAGSSASATKLSFKMSGDGNEVALMDQKLLSIGAQYKSSAAGRSSLS